MASPGNRKNQSHFSHFPSANIQRSVFDRSSALKTTMGFDALYPIFCDEILPGDEIHLSTDAFLRIQPQVVPVMDNMYGDIFYFFVPNRLTWDNWEKFMGAQDNPGDSISYLVPQLTCPPNTANAANIFGFFGLPWGNQGIATSVNVLPFRAYNLIWNEWFRDQNLQNSVTVLTGDGPDILANYNLLLRNKKRDYFTSALPSPQKGPSLSLPTSISSFAPLTGTGVITRKSNAGYWDAFTSGANTQPGAGDIVSDSGSNVQVGSTNVSFDPNGGLELIGSGALGANLTGTITPGSIEQLRIAFQLQSLLELFNRGGTRYTEILQNVFGVTSPDSRLQRPEYLGGGSMRFNVHPVAQTSEASTDSPQGNLAAFTTGTVNGTGFRQSFVEHGYVIGLFQARADLTYQNGLDRMWSRKTRFDFYWPKLAELGEQSVLNQEVVWTGNSIQDPLVWGYQERYAEYRYKPSKITGNFSSNSGLSLDVWHLAQDFSSLPALNGSFMASSTPIDRSLVVQADGVPILADFWFRQKHIRPMPTYSTPVSLGRF